MASLIDRRWESIVRPQFDDLVRVLNPTSFLDRLYREKLVDNEEYQLLRSISSKQEKSRTILNDILPRKGPTSYDRFMTILRETDGQEHVVEALCEQGRRSLVGEEEKREKRRFQELEKKLAKSEMTNIGLRKKIGPSMGSPSLKWKTNMPNMPIGCNPFGGVAEINGMLHVGWMDRMFQFKKGAWEGEEHHLPGIKYIWSVFECEGKGYVMDINEEYRCSSIYEWKSETRDLKLLTKIPDEYQLEWRSAIGHNGNIYLVGGGWGSDRVYCFDINKGEWEPIKKMKNERSLCSLAVIDDKMFVGGGGGARNSVECFSMEKQGWIDIKPTTKELCQLSSWNEKLVATGGVYYGEFSNCVEMYDELSGVWLPLPSMKKGRSSHGACTTKDNQLIVVGGRGAENSVECLKM